MDEVVLRRVVGVITLAIAAFLLSWLLPRPGLDRLRGEGERVVTVDLTRPDSRPQEILPPSPEEAAAVEPQPAPAAPTPEPEPAAVETPEPAKPAEPGARAADAPKPAAAAKPAEPKPAEPKPAEPAKPVPSKPAESKPAEPRPAKPAPAVASSGAGTGQVMVQAGAYSFLDKAEAVRERAGAKGQHCVVSPAETPKGTLYRLRCGPYADRAAAQAAAKALTAAGIAAQVVGGGR